MIVRICTWPAVAAMLLSFTLTAEMRAAEQPEIVSVKRIWDQGSHNAFTDLIRFQDKWFCSFREADDHVGGDGKLRVIVSDDGQAWQSAALLAEEGIDLRDPKLSITPAGQLMIVAGGSVYRGTKTLQGRQPRVAFSRDGRQWTPTERVLSEGDWLWRVTWHDRRAYGVSYHINTSQSPEAAKEPWSIRLVRSDDGRHWETVSQPAVPDRPNETTIRFLSSGELVALVRREGGNTHGWIGVSQPPFEDWSFSETDYRLGGPNFIELPDGSLWGATRDYVNSLKGPDDKKGASTVLCRMTRTSLEPVLLLPSGGDNSYAGLVWHDGLLWMSYYSSHEGKTSIYLAKIRLPQSGKQN
jgi:hypothetical protein